MNYPHNEYVVVLRPIDGHYERRIFTSPEDLYMAQIPMLKIDSMSKITHVSDHEVEMETLFCRHRYNIQSVSQLSGESVS